MHSLGYVANTTQQALDEFYPGYAEAMTKVGKERGWPPMTRSRFEAQIGPEGALLVGSVDEVAAKILRHANALVVLPGLLSKWILPRCRMKN